MKVLKPIGIGILIIVLLAFSISLFLPSKIIIKRSTIVHSSEQIVFDQVNNLKNWEKWSPWAELDPNMETTYNDISSGEGASYTWQGNNDKVKSGTLTIVSSIPCESIITSLDFGKEGKGNGKWVFEKQSDGTKVTWSMEADMGWSPVGKIFGQLMDKFLGPTFEAGLEKIKNVSESGEMSNAN